MRGWKAIQVWIPGDLHGRALEALHERCQNFQTYLYEPVAEMLRAAASGTASAPRVEAPARNDAPVAAREEASRSEPAARTAESPSGAPKGTGGLGPESAVSPD